MTNRILCFMRSRDSFEQARELCDRMLEAAAEIEAVVGNALEFWVPTPGRVLERGEYAAGVMFSVEHEIEPAPIDCQNLAEHTSRELRKQAEEFLRLADAIDSAFDGEARP